MRFIEFGKKAYPTIILIHGGGLAHWSFFPVAKELEKNYHVVLPCLSGHGGEMDTYVSHEECAQKIMSYIHSECHGKIFAIGGLSVGAQIALTVLSKDSKIAQYAIIESCEVIPSISTKTILTPAIKTIYPLIKQKWFSKKQAEAISVPDTMWPYYYRDIQKMSSASLTNLVKDSMSYTIPPTLKNTLAHTLILFGEKEVHSVRKSARLISETIPHSQLYTTLGMKHGEFSLQHPKHYARLLQRFFKL